MKDELGSQDHDTYYSSERFISLLKNSLNALEIS